MSETKLPPPPRERCAVADCSTPYDRLSRWEGRDKLTRLLCHAHVNQALLLLLHPRHEYVGELDAPGVVEADQ